MRVSRSRKRRKLIGTIPKCRSGSVSCGCSSSHWLKPGQAKNGFLWNAFSSWRLIHNGAGHEEYSYLAPASSFPEQGLLPFVLVTVLFFLWGIPNNRNAALIRQFMKSFSINLLRAGLIQSAFYMGYFFAATPSRPADAQTGIQGGVHYGSRSLWNWGISVLARCCHWALFRFSAIEMTVIPKNNGLSREL